MDCTELTQTLYRLHSFDIAMGRFCDAKDTDQAIEVRKKIKEEISKMEIFTWQNFAPESSVNLTELIHVEDHFDHDEFYEKHGVWHIHITPDGNRAILLSNTESLIIYDHSLPLNRTKIEFPPSAPKREFASAITISPDSKKLLARTVIEDSEGSNYHDVYEFDLETKQFQKVEEIKQYERFSYLENGNLMLVRKKSPHRASDREVEIAILVPGETEPKVIFGGEIPKAMLEIESKDGPKKEFRVIGVTAVENLCVVTYESTRKDSTGKTKFSDKYFAMIDIETGKILDIEKGGLLSSHQEVIPYGDHFYIEDSEGTEWHPDIKDIENGNYGVTREVMVSGYGAGNNDEDTSDADWQGFSAFGYSEKFGVAAFVAYSKKVMIARKQTGIKIGEFELPKNIEANEIRSITFTPDRRILLLTTRNLIFEYCQQINEEDDEL